MRARAAWAAFFLCGIIAFCAVTDSAMSGAINVIDQSEVRGSTFVEYIDIFNRAKNIKGYFPFLKSFFLFGTKLDRVFAEVNLRDSGLATGRDLKTMGTLLLCFCERRSRGAIKLIIKRDNSFTCGCLSVVLKSHPKCWDQRLCSPFYPSALQEDVSPQLPFCGSSSVRDQIAGCLPKTPSGNKQKTSKDRQQRISYFQPIAQERRPELGSFFCALLAFWLSFISLGRGIATRERGGNRYKEWAYNIAGLFLGFYAVFGAILLGLDPWTLLR